MKLVGVACVSCWFTCEVISAAEWPENLVATSIDVNNNGVLIGFSKSSSYLQYDLYLSSDLKTWVNGDDFRYRDGENTGFSFGYSGRDARFFAVVGREEYALPLEGFFKDGSSQRYTYAYIEEDDLPIEFNVDFEFKNGVTGNGVSALRRDEYLALSGGLNYRVWYSLDLDGGLYELGIGEPGLEKYHESPILLIPSDFGVGNSFEGESKITIASPNDDSGEPIEINVEYLVNVSFLQGIETRNGVYNDVFLSRVVISGSTIVSADGIPEAGGEVEMNYDRVYDLYFNHENGLILTDSIQTFDWSWMGTSYADTTIREVFFIREE